jgi:site-specific recombinase XerD
LRATTDTVVGLRDRVLIGLMIYTFVRFSAAVNMDVKDVYPKTGVLVGTVARERRQTSNGTIMTVGH